MLTSRRDYILRIIDEVGRLLARVLLKRREGREQEALEAIVQACERLFGLEAHQLFQFTPDQHYAMLADGEPREIARQKLALYAALNAEAGQAYLRLGKRPLARATLLTALRTTLRAQADFPGVPVPACTPDAQALLAALAEEPLDPDTAALVSAAGLPPR